MENFILSEHFVSISLLTISILYCIPASCLIYASSLKKDEICINPNELLMIISILYFVLAGHLICVLYSQKGKKIYNSEINQNKLILKATTLKTFIPKDRNNALFLKTHLKTYYKKVPDEIENIIVRAINDLSHKHDIDFNLIVGIIGVESSFDPYAVSKIGARGLMQVRYGVWKNHLEISNITKLHNIHEGIEYGILAFLQCRKEAKGNLIMALQKYSGTKGLDYINKVNEEINRFTLLKQNKGESINDSQLNQRLSNTNRRKTK